MSKNHPHDNIYSIIGKLDALKPTPEEKRFALVKEIRESIEAQGSIIEGVDAVQAKLARQFAESMDEKAPPGAKAERMVKGIKKSLSKDGHLSDKDKAIAYATTWKAHNKSQVEEAYNPVKAVKQCAKSYMEMNGIRSVHDLEAEDIESIGGDCQMNYQDVCEILGCNLPDSLGPVKSWDTDEHGNKFDMEEGVCNECGMMEGCSCDHTNEAEITRTPGKTVHRKTDFPGYPVDDINADDDEPRGRGRPRKHVKKEPTGLGRGRPKKAAPLGANAPKMHDPFGRVGTGASKLKGSTGRIHSMDEAMALVTQSLTSTLNEGRLLDEAGETLDHILNRFRHEVRNFEQGGDLDQDLYHALFDYYNDNGDMPYGVAKARDDDPMNWVAQNLESHLRGHGIVGGNQEEDPMLAREAGIPGNVPAEQIPGKEDLLKGQGRSYYEEDSIEEELNELARLAGLNTTEGNAFTGKLKDTSKGDKFELDGKEYTDTSTLDEEKIDVDEPEDDEELENAPKPKYSTIKQITTQGDDLNRQKKQDPLTANRAANPFTNEDVITLEAELMAEYESIKKVSK